MILRIMCEDVLSSAKKSLYLRIILGNKFNNQIVAQLAQKEGDVAER